jgi:hypothetical protein
MRPEAKFLAFSSNCAPKQGVRPRHVADHGVKAFPAEKLT